MEKRIAIISEGITDQIIIKYIIKALLGIDTSQITSLLPTDVFDETDLATIEDSELSNWGIVVDECANRTRIDEFLSLPTDDEKIVVIHMDTDMCEEPRLGVIRPSKQQLDDYCYEIITLVAEKMTRLLGMNIENLCYAIAIEETESWILPFIIPVLSSPESSSDPKRRLKKSEQYKNLKQSELPDKYKAICKPISKKRELNQCRARVRSLDLFCTALEALYKAD